MARERYLAHRMIPERYLDKQVTVTYWAPGRFFNMDVMEETTTTGLLEFSGEYHIKLKYYRRNKTTKRNRQYFQTIYKADMIDWHETSNQPTLGI